MRKTNKMKVPIGAASSAALSIPAIPTVSLLVFALILLSPFFVRAETVWRTGWEGDSVTSADTGYQPSNFHEGLLATMEQDSANCYAGSKCLKINWVHVDNLRYPTCGGTSCPNGYSPVQQWANLTGGDYRWMPSTLGGATYYVELASGGNPNLAGLAPGGRPRYVEVNGVLLTHDEYAPVGAGQFHWGDEELPALGYNTLYVHLPDNTDPDTKPSGYINAQPYSGGEEDGADEIYLTVPGTWGLTTRDYYIGWAWKLDPQWLSSVGRKIFYRTGTGAPSMFFQGTKGLIGSTNDWSTPDLYFKNNWGGGVETDEPSNVWISEHLYPGGPRVCAGSCTATEGCNTTGTFTDWPNSDNDYSNMPTDGQWHTVVLHVYEHATDGVMELWRDGVKALEINKDSWNGTPCPQTALDTLPEETWYSYKFPTYFNAGPPKEDQAEYWDNFIIATTREEVEQYLGTYIADTNPPVAPSGLAVE